MDNEKIKEALEQRWLTVTRRGMTRDEWKGLDDLSTIDLHDLIVILCDERKRRLLANE